MCILLQLICFPLSVSIETYSLIQSPLAHVITGKTAVLDGSIVLLVLIVKLLWGILKRA